MAHREPRRRTKEEDELEDRVVRIDRTRKTVAGGRVFSSRAVVVVGDRRGSVGLGIGKARNAPDAVAKARERAKRNMIRVPLDGYTIPHEVIGSCGAARVLLKPASRGTGIIAGGAVRQIIDVSGIRDVLTKSLGQGTVFNRARATFEALKMLRDPREVAAMRGKSVEEMLGRSVTDPYEKAAEEAEEEEAAEETEAAEGAEVAEGQAEEAAAPVQETPEADKSE
ncbi:MAG: 30S ribosomal protein S5 [Armatimonadetes bacterium]|nr:30S ribosomal protein S5 [Armatimonadota bacterium]